MTWKFLNFLDISRGGWHGGYLVDSVFFLHHPVNSNSNCSHLSFWQRKQTRKHVFAFQNGIENFDCHESFQVIDLYKLHSIVIPQPIPVVIVHKCSLAGNTELDHNNWDCFCGHLKWFKQFMMAWKIDPFGLYQRTAPFIVTQNEASMQNMILLFHRLTIFWNSQWQRAHHSYLLLFLSKKLLSIGVGCSGVCTIPTSLISFCLYRHLFNHSWHGMFRL